jgi:hypothetical protein
MCDCEVDESRYEQQKKKRNTSTALLILHRREETLTTKAQASTAAELTRDTCAKMQNVNGRMDHRWSNRQKRTAKSEIFLTDVKKAPVGSTGARKQIVHGGLARGLYSIIFASFLYARIAVF